MIFYPKILSTSIAVLGKTGSGKSSTVKLAIERIVASGGRVCILDPIKSDYWGLTSSVDGSEPGLPFTILGGPRGHILLQASAGRAVGGLVANGTLPLSIIDMADFGAGGSLRFFNAFAEVLCKELKGVLHLVIEEAHEFAPKERVGVGEENMAIYWSKRLATGMRSKGLRLIVATHRVQGLHNAVLGSCETMIAHRLIAPADQKPVLDWFKANATKEQAATVSADLAKLATGTGYFFSGEENLFRKFAFPPIATFDNTKTPDGNIPERNAVTGNIDVAGLRALIGDAVQEAEANDPKKLKAEVARLKNELASVSASIDRSKNGSHESEEDRAAEIDIARTTGYDRGYIQGARIARKGALEDLKLAAAAMRETIDEALAAFESQIPGDDSEPPGGESALRAPKIAIAAPTLPPGQKKPPVTGAAPANGGSPLPAPEQRIINALDWWAELGTIAPKRVQIAMVAGYAPTSGTFATYLSRLSTAGYIRYPSPGSVELTDAGRFKTVFPKIAFTRPADAVREFLPAPLCRIFDALMDFAAPVSRTALAQRIGHQPTSGSFATYLSRLASLEIIEYPQRGMVKIADWAKR